MLEETDGTRTKWYEWHQKAEAHAAEGYYIPDTTLEKKYKTREKEVTGGTH